MDDISACLNQLDAILNKYAVAPGSLTHSVEQLKVALEADLQGNLQAIEQQIQASIQTPSGATLEINRVVDLVTEGVLRGIHTEVKTGANLAAALNIDQLVQDAALAIKLGIDNVWRLTEADFSKSTAAFEGRIIELKSELQQLGFSDADIRKALESFRFTDKLGNVLTAELNEKGDLIFKDAMGVIFGPDGKVAQAATSAASGSPNFEPAMEAIFGPSGKVANAATQAAGGANLEPASEKLEKKIEDGVGGAMSKAGENVALNGAKELGQKITSGATALGNLFTSVPQLYTNISQLGEAWDKPNKSTKDYMTLFTALGGTISSGVQVIQALVGVTELASAAQAIFNAIATANPYVLIVIAVLALIAAIVLLIVYWDEVKAAVRDNPWLLAIGLILGPIFILIAAIIAIAAYWDEVKLAVLQAANFVSIQVQKMGQFFVGLGTLAGMVWDFIVATAENLGISILNTFITIGVQVQNFFIGLVNAILGMYNEVASSAAGQLAGLKPAELIPEVDLKAKLIPPKDVPKIDVDAAFKKDTIKGGLEGAIADQQKVVADAQAADEKRRAEQAAQQAAPPGAPGVVPGAPPGVPGLPGAPPALPAVPGLPAAPALPPGAPGGPPGLPPVPAAAAPAGGGGVTVNGGITVNINAEKLEADAAQLLSDEIIQQLQARLGALASDQDRRVGVRA